MSAPSQGVETTYDVISDTLTIAQHRPGYRFGLDSLLLATDLPALAPGDAVWELGAAQGAVILSVASRCPELRAVAVERQAGLLGLLHDNIARNGLGARVEVLGVDLRTLKPSPHAHAAALVLCNPPYFRPEARRVSPNQERAEARAELHGDVRDFITTAAYLLRPKGWLKLIIPPVRLADVFAALPTTDLGLVRLRFFHAREGADAYLVEILARRARAADVVITSPLIIRDAAGAFTPEVAARVASAARHAPDAP